MTHCIRRRARASHAFAGILLLALSLAAAGCGHTNNLATYPTNGEEYETQSRISREAGGISVSMGPGTGNPFADIGIAIGTGAASLKALEKLSRAVKPEGVAGAISMAFEKDAVQYLRIHPAGGGVDTTGFLIRTNLDQFQIRSHPEGIYLHVKAEVTIISRRNGGIVWEDGEETDVPIRRTEGASIHPVAATIAGIVNAAQLLELSEAEIQDAVLFAAGEVGMQIGDVLREDVAKLSRK